LSPAFKRPSPPVITSRPIRLMIAILALPLIVLGVLVVSPLLLGEPSAPADYLHVLTNSVFFISGVVLPWFVVSIYTLRSAQPRWWVAGLVALGVVVAATALSAVAGMLLGAQTD
jgi:hypothetical protein